MARRLNKRLLFMVVLLAALATTEILREHRPSFLRPGLRLYAYVANSGDGTVSVVDLIGLATRATIPVGSAPMGMAELAARKQVWGASRDGGYIWVLDAPAGAIIARIAVGAGPLGVSFSPDEKLAYVTASGANSVVSIDTTTRQVVARARTGHHPGPARVTPDGHTVLVPNRDDGTLELFDAQTLAPLGSISVAPHPEQIEVLPDSSLAFVSSSDDNQISAVDLHRRVLIANLQLGGRPGRMILKPDGGELYVTVPETHGIEIINTQTTEVAESKLVGLAPVEGALASGADQLFLSDSAAGRVIPIAISTRFEGARISVGRNPGASKLDPSGELLMVANRDSNDLAVIAVRTSSASGLLTLVPVGQQPSDVAVLLF